MNIPILATEKDLNDCFQVIDECSEWLAERGMTHWRDYYDKEKVLSKIESKDFDFYLMRNSSGNPVATITLGTIPPEYYRVNEENVNHMAKFSEPDQAAIYGTALGVRPEYQGSGYGKMLISFMEEETKKRGIKFIRFDARGDYTELISLYKKLGYKIIGEIPDTDSHYYLFEKEVI